MYSKEYEKFLTKFVIAIVVLIVIIFTQPTSEVVKCDAYYKCKVEHSFCHFINIKRNFTLNPNSYITIFSGIRVGSGKSRSRSSHIARVKYDDFSPFIADLCEERWSDDLAKSISNEEEIFWKYMENPQSGYITKSKANPIGLWVCLFFYFLIGGSLLLPQKSHKA